MTLQKLSDNNDNMAMLMADDDNNTANVPMRQLEGIPDF